MFAAAALGSGAFDVLHGRQFRLLRLAQPNNALTRKKMLRWLFLFLLLVRRAGVEQIRTGVSFVSCLLHINQQSSGWRPCLLCQFSQEDTAVTRRAATAATLRRRATTGGANKRARRCRGLTVEPRDPIRFLVCEARARLARTGKQTKKNTIIKTRAPRIVKITSQQDPRGTGVGRLSKFPSTYWILLYQSASTSVVCRLFSFFSVT